MSNSSRKPFKDLTNNAKVSNRKPTSHLKDDSEEELSLEIRRFERIRPKYPQYSVQNNQETTDESIIEDLHSLSMSHSTSILDLEEQDSLDLLPDKYSVSFKSLENNRTDPMPIKNFASKVTNQRLDESFFDKHSRPKPSNSNSNPGSNPSVRALPKKNGKNHIYTLSAKENTLPKHSYAQTIEDSDREPSSFNSSDLIRLKARFESLQTKYETLQVESQDKILLLEKQQESIIEEYKQKLSQQDAILDRKILEIGEQFTQEKKSIHKSYEADRKNFEQQIASLEETNSTLSTLLNRERKDHENEIANLQKIISESEQKETQLRAEIHRLGSEKRSSAASSSGPRGQESNALHAQIKALEDALSAERSLSMAKLTSLRQQIQEEHESSFNFFVQKIKDEMHSKWKFRLAQIKESWSVKKRSLINKVTGAFEKKLAELTLEWERERNLLLARIHEKKNSTNGIHHYKKVEDDTLVNEDLFSDSFKIDEDAIFKISTNEPLMASSQIRSPILQRTPHFMSRSRLPSIGRASCGTYSPDFH